MELCCPPEAHKSSCDVTTVHIPAPNFFGGCKVLTMTMTPWNLTHGQWSKNLTMATDILECAPWSMAKIVILSSNFVV